MSDKGKRGKISSTTVIKALRVMVQCTLSSLRKPGQKYVSCQLSPARSTNISPVPWLVSVFLILAGVVTWAVAAKLSIEGLAEAARIMIYAPIGNMYGMSYAIVKRSEPLDSGT